MRLKKNANQTFSNFRVFHKKSGGRLLIGETRWRAREEAQTKQSLVLRGLLREVNSMCCRHSGAEASRADGAWS
jgi:hypothetical protein